MKKPIFLRCLPVGLIALAFLVTGCPHDDYTVQLKPQGQTISRTLTFRRVDGTNDQTFDADELALITAQYPSNTMTAQGKGYVVHGDFGSQLPGDIGGSGVYTNLTTSLGNAGFYLERFRGSDDLAAMAEKRSHAADQLTDLLIGWSHAELAHEAGYSELHHFLDVDFRHDLKNASDYWWQGGTIKNYQTNATEEFGMRFSQYLLERGYFKLDELPGLVQDFNSSDSQAMVARLQRLVARKMGVAETNPIPASLAFLDGGDLMKKSFTNYLAHTDAYQSKHKQWNETKKAKKMDADTKGPDADAMMQASFNELLAEDFDLFGGQPDHLRVQLALPAPPLHSNGHWDDAAKQETWDSDLVNRTNLTHLPFSCYATWSQADEDFQKAHFGKVALTGDDLVQYSLWRRAQNQPHGDEWDSLLASLQPGKESLSKLDAFRFSNEPNQVTTNSSPSTTDSSAYPRGLLKKLLP